VFAVPPPEQVRQLGEIGEAIGEALHRAESTESDPSALPWRRR
jgi:hypothetical protein